MPQDDSFNYIMKSPYMYYICVCVYVCIAYHISFFLLDFKKMIVKNTTIRDFFK